MRQDKGRNKDAYADYEATLRKLEGESDSGIIVRHRGEWSEENGQRAFFTTKTQLEWLRLATTGTHKQVIFLDATHGTNQYNLQLFTVAVQLPGIALPLPCSFMLVYVPPGKDGETQAAVEWFLEQVHKEFRREFDVAMAPSHP